MYKTIVLKNNTFHTLPYIQHNDSPNVYESVVLLIFFFVLPLKHRQNNVRKLLSKKKKETTNSALRTCTLNFEMLIFPPLKCSHSRWRSNFVQFFFLLFHSPFASKLLLFTVHFVKENWNHRKCWFFFFHQLHFKW